MSDTPLISCIMPTYGRPDFLGEAVAMFLAQDYPAKELILLNDCVGQTFHCDLPGVTVINSPERYPSLGEKRNAAIELAKGDILAVWDDDDIHMPWRLSFSMREMQRFNTEFYRPAEFWAYWGSPELHDNQAVPSWLSHGLVLFTRSLWKRTGGYPPQGVGEDAVFFERIHQELKQDFIKYPIDRDARFYVMRGTSQYHHMSISGGSQPLDTSPLNRKIVPSPIQDPLLCEVTNRLIGRYKHKSTITLGPTLKQHESSDQFQARSQKIRRRVTFCLFSNAQEYVLGALENIQLVHRHYPGWETVFYTRDVDDSILNQLTNEGANVVQCDFLNMLLARFIPFSEEGIVISRDCDSRIGDREARAVSEWLNSEMPAHVIRDHPQQLPGIAHIQAGLWGSRMPFGENLRNSLYSALNDPCYSGLDGAHRWLMDFVWRPDGFMIHQFDQVDWMRDSWNPSDYCGLRRRLAAPGHSNEVVLFEGFFNRLNGLVTALLTHGPRFRVRWAINNHLPHRFHDFFDDIPGISVTEEENLTYWPQNNDPANGPLCNWYVPKSINKNSTEISEAYRFFLIRLKVTANRNPSKIAIHFRGLHHASNLPADAFALWCVSEIKARGFDSCFAIADSERERIESILKSEGIRVNWGISTCISNDLDRAHLQGVKAFISDVLTLSGCDSVLTSFEETTIVDSARAFDREVVACTGSRSWSDCWFEHCGKAGRSTSS